MIVAEDNEAVGGAAAQTADVAQSAGANVRNGRRPGDAPEGTVFMSRTKSFTRRSRELPPNLARTWDAHAERYVIEPRRGIGYTTVAEDFRLDPVELFGRRAPLTLEIGSGTGEQIVAAAAAHPDRDYLALEVWVPGIAKLVSKAVEAGVSRKVKAQCIRQHIKLCQPREILTPRMSRESLCDMGEKVAARATLSAPIVIIGEALELRRCHELCAPRQYLGFQNG